MTQTDRHDEAARAMSFAQTLARWTLMADRGPAYSRGSRYLRRQIARAADRLIAAGRIA